MKKSLLYAIIIVVLFAGLIFATVATAEEVDSPTNEETPTQQAEVNPNSAYAAVAEYEAKVAEEEVVRKFLDELNRQEEVRQAEEAAAAKAAAPAPQREYVSADGTGRWDQLAQCETGGNWATNTGNGYGGGLQFAHQRSWSTWLSYGGGEFAPNPWDASREQQIVVAERVLAGSGWGAWPGCSRRYGWL
jgi:hypothetical protein